MGPTSFRPLQAQFAGVARLPGKLDPYPLADFDVRPNGVIADSNYSSNALMACHQILFHTFPERALLYAQISVAYARVRDVDKTLAWKEILRLDDGVIRDERSGPAGFWKDKGSLSLRDSVLGAHQQ